MTHGTLSVRRVIALTHDVISITATRLAASLGAADSREAGGDGDSPELGHTTAGCSQVPDQLGARVLAAVWLTTTASSCRMPSC